MNDEEKVNGEVVDARTGEIIPIGEIQKPQSNTLATSLDLTKVGTLVLDEKAESVLGEPLKPEDVQIRPDGLVYLPWTWYAERLNRAFGRLQWGLVPQAGPQSKNTGDTVLVVWGHWLVVRGVPVGFEMGETSYRPDNQTMSFGDAAAGAKSNSLARNCKMLGMSLELWNQQWISDWKEKYAQTYTNEKGRRLWKKKVNGKTEQKTTDATKASDSKSESVEIAINSYVASQLNTVPMVDLIAKEAKKSKKEVAVLLNKLDKKVSYSISQIVNMLNNGEQNAQS